MRFLSDRHSCCLLYTSQGRLFIPAHVAPFEDAASIVKRNRRWVYETGDCIVEFLQTPRTFETLLKAVFDRYDLQMTFGQHLSLIHI